MRSIRVLVLVACLPLVLLLGGCGSGKKAKTDQQMIQGTWVVQSLEVGGKASKDMDNAEWTFTNDAVELRQPGREIVTGAAKSGQPIMTKAPDRESKGTFHLNPTKNPREIDLTMQADGQEREVAGIYIVEHDKLTLGIPTKKDGPRATSWSEPGLGVLTLKRVK